MVPTRAYILQLKIITLTTQHSLGCRWGVGYLKKDGNKMMKFLIVKVAKKSMPKEEKVKNFKKFITSTTHPESSYLLICCWSLAIRHDHGSVYFFLSLVKKINKHLSPPSFPQLCISPRVWFLSDSPLFSDSRLLSLPKLHFYKYTLWPNLAIAASQFPTSVLDAPTTPPPPPNRMGKTVLS